MSATPARATHDRSSLFGRLAAWWEGADASSPQNAPIVPIEADASPPIQLRAELNLRSWSAERLEIAQHLYGPGWLSPGGEPLYVELLNCLLLKESESVLQHGAALAGLLRLIVRQTGVWGEAQEEDPLLAAEAARQNKAAALSRKIAVLGGPLRSAGAKPRSRHAVVSAEALYRVADKEAELATLCAVLKPGGQFMLTDFVRKGAGVAAIARWARCEANEPHFVAAEELKALLERRGFDVRVFEDRSRDYCRTALAALQALLRRMETSPVRPALRGWLVWEIEVLTQKLQAIDSGAIGFQRILAVAPADKIAR